jgi:hypothetical protein
MPEVAEVIQPARIHKLIDAATIKPATFASFAGCISEAHRMTQRSAIAPNADVEAK